jgi:hypothetical protein
MIENDTWIIIGISLVVVVGIAIWIKMTVKPVEERFDRARMRERDA